MKSTYRTLLTLALLTIVSSTQAQSLSSDIDPFGRIFSARIPSPDLPTDAEAAPEQRTFTIAALTVGDSSTAKNGSVALGILTEVNKRQLFVQGKYTHVDNDQGGTADRVFALGQYGIIPDGPFPVALVAFAGYDPNAFKIAGAAVAIERSLLEDLSANANIQWATLAIDGGGSLSDLQPGLGLVLTRFENWSISVDYTFDNDLDGEDTGSATVVRSFKGGRKLKLGAEKHKVLSVSFSQAF